jgi:murein L,D-transpeptidase YafK
LKQRDLKKFSNLSLAASLNSKISDRKALDLKKVSGVIIVILLVSIVAFQNWSEKQLLIGIKADYVVANKGRRELMLFSGIVIKKYSISLGRSPSGAKVSQGDNKTHEGLYRLDWRNANSKYYKSIHISCPNQNDIERASKLGISPGGDIMIHGVQRWLNPISRFHRFFNLKRGCIVVTNREMDEIWNAVPDGTPIEIGP